MHNGSIDTWLTSSVTVMAACQTYCFPGKIFFVLSFWNWYKFSMTTNFSQIKVHPYSLEVHGYIQSRLPQALDHDLLQGHSISLPILERQLTKHIETTHMVNSPNIMIITYQETNLQNLHLYM